MSKKINLFLFDILDDLDNLKKYVYKNYLLPQRIERILTILKGYPQSSIFLNKVTKKEAPDYHLIIKNPMDLGTVQKKIYKYETYEEFKKDLDLIWDNCITYNAGPYFIKCAETMRNAVINAEIERIPVARDPRFEANRIYVEGKGNMRDRNFIRKIICKVLRDVGYEKGSKECIDILVDLFEYKISQIIREI